MIMPPLVVALRTVGLVKQRGSKLLERVLDSLIKGLLELIASLFLMINISLNVSNVRIICNKSCLYMQVYFVSSLYSKSFAT